MFKYPRICETTFDPGQAEWTLRHIVITAARARIGLAMDEAHPAISLNVRFTAAGTQPSFQLVAIVLAICTRISI